MAITTFLTARTALVALALLPVAVPTVYLLYLKHRVSRHTTSSAGRRSPRVTKPTSPNASDVPALPWKPVSLPEDVKDDSPDSQWHLAYERVVSEPIPASSLSYPISEADDSTREPDGPVSTLMRTYSQAVQMAFSWTPQAFVLRTSLCEPAIRRTFDEEWIRGLAFEDGDVVNAAYRVSYHGQGSTTRSERVEFMLQAPPSYQGAVPHGVLVAEVQAALPGGSGGEVGDVVFVNETWMWRHEGEKLTLIESPTGAWMHTMLVGWLVMKGTAAVTSRNRE